MTAPTEVVYDLTLYEEDGETPIWGDADVYGEPTESSFQTPSPTLPHDRPYLLLPPATTGTELDFLQGASRIGGMTARVQDRRTDLTDQRTGILTAQIGNLPGRRAVFRRYVDGDWVKLHDGPVADFTVQDSEALVYALNLQDARAFERRQSLFFSNHVIFGKDGASGPPINYGRLPGGTYLLQAVEPHPTTFHSSFGVGLFDLPLGGANLGELGNAVQDADGIWRHKDFQIWWRHAASPGSPYTVLRNIARVAPGYAVSYPNMGLGLGSEGTFDPNDFFRGSTTLYAGFADEQDLPNDGDPVEILVLAVNITEDTPFWWDGGTLGDLLAEIVAGDHTTSPPRERYDAAALAEFQATSRPARIMLTEPVEDRRKWVEANIFKADFRAPSFNNALEIVPVGWALPTDHEDAPVLDSETIRPEGNLAHGVDNAIGVIEYTYLRERLDDKKTAIRKKAKKFLGITYGHKLEEVVDDARQDWERLVVTEVPVRIEDPDAAPNAGTLTFAPVTIRSIGGANDAVNGGDTQDELGQQLTEQARTTVWPRYSRGAAKYTAVVRSTVENLRDRYLGEWLRVRAEWLPEYSTGLRELRRFMQVLRISDPSPEKRQLLLLDSGVPDHTENPDVVDPVNGACLAADVHSNAREVVLPSGLRGLLYTADGELVNTCPVPITIPAVVLVAGGGGGGSTTTGGGGGAGGVAVFEDVLVGASVVAPITRGAGGAAGANGEDTILWLHNVTGEALDPLTDDPDDGYVAVGGGAGGTGGVGPGVGGSGGGGGAQRPISGGASHPGAAGTPPQGNAGGSGEDGGGLATCQRSAGGGGGSYFGAGTEGVTQFGEGSSDPGEGGAGGTLQPYGLPLGGGGSGGVNDAHTTGPGCSTLTQPGAQGGGGYGAGGGGAADGAGATPGLPGCALVVYRGATAPTLPPPTVSSQDLTDQNQGQLCIEEEDWYAMVLPGYRVLVYYAFGATEPDPDSGDWRMAGELTAPGCVTSPPAPTGVSVFMRARAEAQEFLPSPETTPGENPTAETPGLYRFEVVVDPATGVATAFWTANPYCGAVRLRGLIHDLGDSTARPLPYIADLAAEDGEYQLPGVVGREQFYTVDAEAWEEQLPPEGNTPVFSDDFTRANASDPGNGWVEQGTSPWGINANKLRADDFGTHYVTNPAAAVPDPSGADELFLQASIPTESNGGGGIVARIVTPGTPTGYGIVLDGKNSQTRLREYTAGAITNLASAARAWDGTFTTQLYVAPGVQEAHADGTSLSAADTTHNGVAGVGGLVYEMDSSEVAYDYDLFLAMRSKYARVSNLPTGYKAKILNDSDVVIAEATEVAGVASVDCSRFGGCDEDVPFNGFAALIVTDDDDVEQARMGERAYPGVDVEYHGAEGVIGGELQGEGNQYRYSDQRPEQELAAPGETIPLTVNEETGTDYELVLADAETYLRLTDAYAITLTVPAEDDVAFPVGTSVLLEQGGLGAITITPAVGVTLNSEGGKLTTADQYAVAQLVKVAADTWTVAGNLVP